MEDRVWDNNPGENTGDVPVTGRANVIINGSAIAVNPGDNTVDVVKRMALDAGFGKFRVMLNGSEVKPSEAPAQISEGDRIEIRPYDVAGLR
jgi:hypothetical protein